MFDDSVLLATTIMSRAVVTVRPDDALRAAVRLMADRALSGLPVTDASGALVGMITEGDLIRWHEGLTERQAVWIERLGEGYQVGASLIETLLEENHLVRSVMSRQVTTAPETISAHEAAVIMERRRIKRLPIMRGNAMIGILSRSDLVRALANEVKIRSAAPQPQSIDEALRLGREEALRQVPTLR